MSSKPTEALTRRGRRRLEGSELRGDDREARLLAIGERLVAEGTFNDTPISEIAREAGISRPGFYFYFESKDELLAGLVADTLTLTLERWTAVMNGPLTDPEDALREIVSRSAQMWEERPLVLSAAVELFSRVPAIREQWLDAVAASREPLADLIVELTQLPKNRDPKHARELAESLIWMFERSFYVATYRGADRDTYRDLTETISDAWVGAMGLKREK